MHIFYLVQLRSSDVSTCINEGKFYLEIQKIILFSLLTYCKQVLTIHRFYLSPKLYAAGYNNFLIPFASNLNASLFKPVSSAGHPVHTMLC